MIIITIIGYRLIVPSVHKVRNGKKTKQNTFPCLLLDHQVTNQHSNAPSNQHLLNARHDLGSYIYYIYNVIV